MVSGIPTASGYEERIRFSEMEVVDRGANEQGLLVNMPEGHLINGWDVNVAGVRTTSVKRTVRYHQHAVSCSFLLLLNRTLTSHRSSSSVLSRKANLISSLAEDMVNLLDYTDVCAPSLPARFSLRYQTKIKVRPHQTYSVVGEMMMRHRSHRSRLTTRKIRSSLFQTSRAHSVAL